MYHVAVLVLGGSPKSSCMISLPNDDDQKWLLRELVEIARARGWEPFLCAPIVQPTPEYFPDPVDSAAAALDRVTRRLMQYAGLGGLDVEITFFEDAYVEGAVETTSCKQIAGCFYGVGDGRCHFGVNADLPSDIEHLAGVMAHEVAHAYRAYHRLCCEDPDREELLTDVTTAYLGFGVLCLNNSFRFRRSGGLMASGWSTSATGYLPPQAHSFLLGGQLVARAAGTRARKAIYRQLETNQAALVKAAVKFFEETPVDLGTALGLPPPASRPAPRDHAGVLQPLEPYAAGAGDPQEEREAPEPWNEGRPVFRIRESTVGPQALLEASVWGAGGFLLSWMLYRSWLGLVPFALVGLVRGWRRGLRSRHDVCSDRDCGAALDPAATRCPDCGGEIMGYLDSSRDRLAMEDKFAEEARRRRQR
jgi:hypothetical protein